ncbi:MAG: HicB family protein [Lactobacillus johnsonii]|nr:HicB family protein [Lactobacillus johnsonii]
MKERIVTYSAIFKPIEDNVYFISFPDVKGAVTEGHGLKDAFEMAADALGIILFDEKKLPKMTDPAEIKIEEPGAFVALVSTDLTKSAANFEKNVTVLAKLFLQAEKKKINFSKVLTEALREKLNYQ